MRKGRGGPVQAPNRHVTHLKTVLGSLQRLHVRAQTIACEISLTIPCHAVTGPQLGRGQLIVSNRAALVETVPQL